MFRWILFFSSYFPVILIYGFLTWEKKPLSFLGVSVWTLGFFCFAVLVLFGMLLYFLPLASGRSSHSLEVGEVEGRDADTMSYIATYLLPFVTFTLDTWQQLVAIGIFIFVIGFIYVSSNMIYINPMLKLLGFHLYEVTEEETHQHFFVLARSRIEQGCLLTVINLRQGVLLEKGS